MMFVLVDFSEIVRIVLLAATCIAIYLAIVVGVLGTHGTA